MKYSKEQIALWQKNHRTKMRKLVLDYLNAHNCVNCGESDPIVLDFDHLNREDKFKTISRMLSGHYGWKAIEKEISKCQVLCANCHRRRTYIQMNSRGRSSDG